MTMKRIFLFVSLITTACAFEKGGEWLAQRAGPLGSHMRRELSLMKPYMGSGASLSQWDFRGTTIITNNYVRLTSDLRSQRGALWSKHANEWPDWELHLNFKVHGTTGDLFGDGMALWYAADRMQDGDVFGYKDYFSGLAIFLDTYSNHNGPHNHGHPYVSAMINNGSLHYDHDRDGTLTQLDGCTAKFRNKDHETLISVRYQNNVLTVATDIDGSNTWKDCFRVERVFLPTGYYFGLSAATGDLSDAHDVISLRFFELSRDENNVDSQVDYSKVIPAALGAEPVRDRHEDPPRRSWTDIFIYCIYAVLVLALICVLAYFGLNWYSNYQSHNRKRFY